MENYVIIGNSTAAVGAIEAIRRRDNVSPLTVVSSEAYHTYSRPLISYLLLGKTTLDKMLYRPKDFYEKNYVTFLGGKTAVKIDADAHCVTLDDGKTLNYTKLLAATGSVPFIPPVDGLESVEKKFTFMTLDSALAIADALKNTPNARVFIVGAGLIGLKCAEGIRDKAASVTVADIAPRILSGVLDADAAEFVRKRLESERVNFVLGESVTKFGKNFAETSSGKKIDFDILITAAGVRPNTSLVKDAGGDVRRGIVTDALMRTSLKDVYAAGDCAESFDVSSGENKVLAILPNAYIQGETAGLSMSGFDKPVKSALPLNAVGFFGLHAATAGTYDGDVYAEITENGFKKLFYKDDVLKGFIMADDAGVSDGFIQKCGIYTNLIREKTPLSSLNFELIRKKPGLMAFSREERIRKLASSESGYGGVY